MGVIVAVLVVVAMIIAGAVLIRAVGRDDVHERFVIATGPETGTYYGLGLALAELLEAEGIASSVEVIATDGSVTNMALVGGPGRSADLAFVQSDTLPANDVRLIAPLYQEVLHVVVARRIANEVTTIDDLQGRRVSLGMAGSGTRSVAQRVIGHFGVTVGADVSLPPDAVAEGLVDGSVDAAFMLGAVPAAIVEELCDRDAIRFLSLGDAQQTGNEADALELVFPSLVSAVIPRSTYRRLPAEPVATVEVSALLVVSSALDAELVKNITSSLFANRSRLLESDSRHAVVARRIRERFQPELALIPYHEGAVRYYHRSDPPFLVEYSETISLVLTVMVGLFSFGVAVREWMKRRMKNRIDDFYVEVEHLTSEIEDLGVDELRQRRRALRDLQRRAFTELVAERLEANESFTILQDFLANERAAISARIAERTAAQSSR